MHFNLINYARTFDVLLASLTEAQIPGGIVLNLIGFGMFLGVIGYFLFTGPLFGKKRKNIGERD